MTLLLKVTYIPKLSALTSTLVFQTFHAFWHIDQPTVKPDRYVCTQKQLLYFWYGEDHI